MRNVKDKNERTEIIQNNIQRLNKEGFYENIPTRYRSDYMKSYEQKNENKYQCPACKFKTYSKWKYNRHCQTEKHIKAKNGG